MRTPAWAALTIVAAAASTAQAGRSAFGWPYDTEMLKPNKAELQAWVTEEDHRGASETGMWVLPVIGVTPALEVALPAVFSLTRADATPDRFTFDRYGIELRYRFVSSVAPPPVVPLVRLAVFRDVTDRSAVRVEADAVASYTAGPVHAVVDVGYQGTLRDGEDEHELYPSAGISVDATHHLRLGVEATAEIEREDDELELEWVIAGPDIAWSHGRFWISAASGIGITGIRAAPRVLWGVLF